MQVSCPYCRGHRSVDGKPCSMCVMGKVDTESVCTCGRPAVLAIADTITCMHVTCVDAAIKPLKKEQTSEATAETWGDFGDYMAWRERGGQ